MGSPSLNTDVSGSKSGNMESVQLPGPMGVEKPSRYRQTSGSYGSGEGVSTGTKPPTGSSPAKYH